MEFIKEYGRIYSVNSENEIIAEITYEKISEGLYNISHTYVDESLRGQKIGQKLIEMAIEEIKKKNGKVEATCSFAKHYLEKNIKERGI